MKKVATLLVLVFASFALVACGGDDDSTTTTTTSAGESNGGAATEGGEKAGGAGGGGANTLKFEADPGGGLAYTSDTASAKAGEVTIDFDNPQPLTHDVAIEDSNGQTVGKTDLISASSTSTSANLKPGTYTFYCSVPGHREAGMEGTLTVE
jgi:plastocyanin